MAGPGAPIDTTCWCAVATTCSPPAPLGPALRLPATESFSDFRRSRYVTRCSADVAALAALGIIEVAAVVGGSMGGARALEWWSATRSGPSRIAVGGRCARHRRPDRHADNVNRGHQPTRIRQSGDYHGREGTRRRAADFARRFAHFTYRGEIELATPGFANHNQGTRIRRPAARCKSYLEHQGDKLLSRPDAGSYVILTEALNSRRRPRPRRGLRALRACPVPVVGRHHSDRLYSPCFRQQELADLAAGLRRAASRRVGLRHDGFLVETEAVGELIRQDAGDWLT